MEKCNQELSDKLAKHKAELEGMRTPGRIRTAIRWRLEMLVPYMGATTLCASSHLLQQCSLLKCMACQECTSCSNLVPKKYTLFSE